MSPDQTSSQDVDQHEEQVAPGEPVASDHGHADALAAPAELSAEQTEQATPSERNGDVPSAAEQGAESARPRVRLNPSVDPSKFRAVANIEPGSPGAPPTTASGAEEAPRPAATRETAELRAQNEQMGRSMLEWLRQRGDDPRVATLAALEPAPTWPLAFALATVHTGAEARDALLAFGFSWAENQVQAALKAVPLGQSAGQRILARLAQDLPAAVDAALAVGDDARQAFTPMLAIRSAQHETQYSRLFRS